MEKRGEYTIFSYNVPVNQLDQARVLGIGLSARSHLRGFFGGPERRTIKKYTRWNDIILVEGHKAGKKLDILDKLLNGIPLKLKAYGWDDEQKNREAGQLFEEATTPPKLNPKDLVGSVEAFQAWLSRREDLGREVLRVALERNPSLIATLNKMAEKHSKRKIVVTAGAAHFTESPEVIRAFSAYPHAVLNFYRG